MTAILAAGFSSELKYDYHTSDQVMKPMTTLHMSLPHHGQRSNRTTASSTPRPRRTLQQQYKRCIYLTSREILWLHVPKFARPCYIITSRYALTWTQPILGYGIAHALKNDSSLPVHIIALRIRWRSSRIEHVRGLSGGKGSASRLRASLWGKQNILYWRWRGVSK